MDRVMFSESGNHAADLNDLRGDKAPDPNAFVLQNDSFGVNVDVDSPTL